MFRILRALFLLLTAFPHVPAWADDVAIDGVVVGFEGAYRVGRWTPLTVQLAGSALPETVVLETVTRDAGGTTARRLSPPLTLTDGAATVRTVFQAGRAGSPVTIRLRDSEGTLLAERRLLAGSTPLPDPLPKEATLAVIGSRFEPTDADAASVPLPETMRTAVLDGTLPVDSTAYDAVNVLIVRGNIAPSPAQARALHDWVAGGGHLAIALGRDTDAFRDGPLAEWIPIDVGGTVQLRDVSTLQNFPRRVRIQVTQLNGGLESYPPGSETPLVVSDLYGFGRVTLFAMDFDQPPFSTWPGLPDLIGHSLADDEITTTRQRRISSPGVTDLGTQLLRAEQSFPSIERRSVGAALLLLLLFAVIVGPLDYLLVHHVLRRPALTWVTLPVIVLLAGWWLHRSAISANGTASLANELHVVDVDAATGTLRGRTAVTLYAADSTRLDMTVSPQTGPEWVAGGETPEPHFGWLAPPESTLGGSWREASGSLFQPDYEMLPAGETASARGIPLLIWSSRDFLARWQTTTASPLVEAEIVRRGAGRAEGTIMHHMPGPLRNVLIAVGDRAFVLNPGEEWYPGEPILLESSLFQQRDLDSYLTRKTTTHVERAPGEGGESFIVSKSIYDPEATDLASIITMMTFHNAAGGQGYTGLTNRLFAADDLSQQLDAGNAVALGQIDVPPSKVTLNAADGAAFETARRTTFVRLIVPTNRIESTVPRSLNPLAPTEPTSTERSPQNGNGN